MVLKRPNEGVLFSMRFPKEAMRAKLKEFNNMNYCSTTIEQIVVILSHIIPNLILSSFDVHN